MNAEVFIPTSNGKSFCMDFEIWNEEFRDTNFFRDSTGKPYVMFCKNFRFFKLHRYLIFKDIFALAGKLNVETKQIHTHHIDRDINNNKLSNLKAILASEHHSLHHKGKITTEESKALMSKTVKNKYKNGYINPRKGNVTDEKMKGRISNTLKNDANKSVMKGVFYSDHKRLGEIYYVRKTNGHPGKSFSIKKHGHDEALRLVEEYKRFQLG